MTPDRLPTLRKALHDVSDFALHSFRSLETPLVEKKGLADYVSETDRRAERLARAAIQSRFPEDSILGEEYGGAVGENYWVVDPIDGTSNLLSGLPIWAVAIAWIEAGRPRLGGVSLPAFGTTMFGGEDCPFEAEGELAEVFPGRPLVIAVGRNGHWDTHDRCADEIAFEQAGYSVVCLGSCAASLALAAAGRLAGYVEKEISIWDCAAGVALCRSAGLAALISSNEDSQRVDVFAADRKAVSVFEPWRPVEPKNSFGAGENQRA